MIWTRGFQDLQSRALGRSATVALIGLLTPVVIVPHQKFSQQVFTHQLVFHHTRLPPTSQRVPLSHCQQSFGLKTTTRTCHCTSHRVGHTIRRHSERLGERQVAGPSAFYKGSIQAICLSNLALSVGFEPTVHITTDDTLAGCWFKPLIQLNINLAHRTGFEPVISAVTGRRLRPDWASGAWNVKLLLHGYSSGQWLLTPSYYWYTVRESNPSYIRERHVS